MHALQVALINQQIARTNNYNSTFYSTVQIGRDTPNNLIWTLISMLETYEVS